MVSGRAKPAGKRRLLDVDAIALRVARVLKKIERWEHGTAKLFCKETGYEDESFLSLAKAGKIGADVTAEKLCALAAALNVHIGWLIAGEGGDEIRFIEPRSITPTPQPKSSVVPRSRP